MTAVTVWRLAALASLLGLGGTVRGADKVVALVEDGRPKAVLVTAPRPTRAAQLAAFELQEHIRLITGATLPITHDAAAAEGVKLFVGCPPAAGLSGDFADQEYAILFRPGAIVLAGRDKADFGSVHYWATNSPRLRHIEGTYAFTSWPDFFDAKGTLHAAYDFLESYCGVRWFNPTEHGTDVPRSPTLTVAARVHRRAPAFAYRDPNGWFKANLEHYNRSTALWTVRWSEPTPKYQEWLALAYEQGRKDPAASHPHRWLGYERGRVFAFLTRRKLGGEPFKTNHSFYDWYDRFWERNPKNPEVFVEKKPHWFAQGYPDAKVPPQLCYSNPEVVGQCLADARAFFALSPEERAGRRLGTDRFFPVVPMDNSSYCKCPACTALSDPATNRSHFSRGDYSRLVWGFVNQVARGLKPSHPDKMVSALAYSGYALRPAGLAIEDNIAVQLCLFPRAAATSPATLANDDAILQQWNDGRPIYLWLYTCLTTGHMPATPMFPGPMGRLYGGLFQKYRAAGVRGLFYNGVPQPPDDYFLFRLADDPDLDFDALRNDYFVRMYGPVAGKTLDAFYRQVESIYTNPRNYPANARGPALWWGVLGTSPRMARLGALVAQAERELAGAPELWRKRFAVFKLGTWDYMQAGRTQYEKNKIATASAPLSLACPQAVAGTAGGDPARADWLDAQRFGGHNGWLKDNGDSTLRRITSSMIHDGRHLYLKLVEDALDRAPSADDRWELAVFDRATEVRYTLWIDATGTLSGQTQGTGVPQAWADHGARADSRVADGQWTVTVALPVSALPVDPDGRLFMNLRRHDAAGEDSPVLVATGDAFETGKTGALVAFGKPPAETAPAPAAEACIADCDFSGGGDTVRDRSGRGNEAKLFGAARRDEAGLAFTDGNAYLEFAGLKGFDPTNYTLSCWIRYPQADAQGSRRLFTVQDFHGAILTPNRQAFVRWNDAKGTLTGRGPGGPELTPGIWHLLTLTHDGRHYVLYANGRPCIDFPSRAVTPCAPDAVWRIGGAPHLAPWYTFLGTFGRIRFYGRALSPAEVMALYAADYVSQRKQS